MVKTTDELSPTLQTADLDLLFEALAAADAREAVSRAVDRIASTRFGVTVFSASLCFLETLELERVYSSMPEAYPVGSRKSKRETSWARQVMQERRVFVGEGPLEMAAAFDDQVRMESLGIRSIINVPMVARNRCLGVLNFGRGVERVMPADVAMARVLGLISTAAFIS